MKKKKKLRNSATSVTLPKVTKQVCPGGKFGSYSHFPKDMTVSCFHEDTEYSNKAFAVSALIWHILTFGHLHSLFISLLPWVYLISPSCLRRELLKKKKKKLNSLITHSSKCFFVWICDILFKQICCFVYLNVVLLKYTAVFASVWDVLDTLPVQVYLYSCIFETSHLTTHLTAYRNSILLMWDVRYNSSSQQCCLWLFI